MEWSLLWGNLLLMIFFRWRSFYQLNTNHLSGTENIILRTEYGNEIFAKYDEILKIIWTGLG